MSKKRDDAKNFASNVRQLFAPKGQTPAEEAATFASGTHVVATATAGYSARWQQRLTYSIRWLQALQETAQFAQEAFGQVAEEALLDVVGAGEQPDFITNTTGDTEKVAGTEPPPPMDGSGRRGSGRSDYEKTQKPKGSR